MLQLDSFILEVLRCPSCREDGSIAAGSEGSYRCRNCGVHYPVVKGRPIMVAPNHPEISVQELTQAAEALPHRDAVRDRAQSYSTQHQIFESAFPQLDRRNPEWKFLADRVMAMADEIGAGTRVLDIGAGEAPYGRILKHADYVATDLVWSSDRHDFSEIDVVTDATEVAISSSSFDVALSFVVFEHVSEPSRAAAELARVLRKGGTMYALIPLVRPEHMAPFDFHRFTRYGIRRMFESVALRVVEIAPSNGSFWTGVRYAREEALMRPIRKHGRHSWKAILLNRFWWLLFSPLLWYARRSDHRYGDNFPIYYWVRAVRE